MSKNSTDEEINKALVNGGKIVIEGSVVFIDNPENYSVIGVPTGFWIRAASGFKVYFKSLSRKKAQECCDKLFGKNMYKVNSKV